MAVSKRIEPVEPAVINFFCKWCHFIPPESIMENFGFLMLLGGKKWEKWGQKWIN